MKFVLSEELSFLGQISNKILFICNFTITFNYQVKAAFKSKNKQGEIKFSVFIFYLALKNFQPKKLIKMQ